MYTIDTKHTERGGERAVSGQNVHTQGFLPGKQHLRSVGEQGNGSMEEIEEAGLATTDDNMQDRYNKEEQRLLGGRLPHGTKITYLRYACHTYCTGQTYFSEP